MDFNSETDRSVRNERTCNNRINLAIIQNFKAGSKDQNKFIKISSNVQIKSSELAEN